MFSRIAVLAGFVTALSMSGLSLAAASTRAQAQLSAPPVILASAVLPPAADAREGTASSQLGSTPSFGGPWLGRGTSFNFTIDAGMTADSNVTNSSNDRFLPIRVDGVMLPIALDPSLRARSGTGRGAAGIAELKLGITEGAKLAIDAEAQVLDYKGRGNDDASFLVAAGPEIGWSGGGSAAVQIVGARSWYGGTSIHSGLGLRARLSTPITAATRVNLFVDGREFESGYGREFGGRQADMYLGTSTTIDAKTTGSLGLYGRREWLRDKSYSGATLGLFGGISRSIGDAFTANLSAGVSRTRYDAPVLLLSDTRRRDWRLNAGIELTTRKPIGLGVHPTIGYSFNRTNASIGFFDADRHRVRFGMKRAF